jgi:hypothetical protein
MVYVGDVDLEGDGVIHTIAQLIIHPDYINDVTAHFRNNIALIEVSFIYYQIKASYSKNIFVCL